MLCVWLTGAVCLQHPVSCRGFCFFCSPFWNDPRPGSSLRPSGWGPLLHVISICLLKFWNNNWWQPTKAPEVWFWIELLLFYFYYFRVMVNKDLYYLIYDMFTYMTNHVMLNLNVLSFVSKMHIQRCKRQELSYLVCIYVILWIYHIIYICWIVVWQRCPHLNFLFSLQKKLVCSLQKWNTKIIIQHLSPIFSLLLWFCLQFLVKVTNLWPLNPIWWFVWKQDYGKTIG